MTVGVALTIDGATEAQYDEVHKLVTKTTPEGLIFHSMGSVDNSLMIFDVWKDEESFQQFSDDVMVPAVARVASGARPTVKTWPLHNVWQADARELQRIGADKMPATTMA